MFCVRATPGGDPLDDYDRVKTAIQQAFADNRATLSQHDAVGPEHARWLEQDVSAPGVAMLRVLSQATAPGGDLKPRPGS